jgi:hypothetical protein
MKRVRSINDLSKKLGSSGYIETDDGEKVRIVKEQVTVTAPAPPPDNALPKALAEMVEKLVRTSEERTAAMLAEQGRMIDRLATPRVEKVESPQADTKQPHRWVFTIQRDEIGRLQQITATPVST